MQVDFELRSLLDSGAIAFPSAFTFVARAFTSVDGIAKSLTPDYELRAAIEPFVGQIISDEYSSQARAQRDALLGRVQTWLRGGEAPNGTEGGAPLASSRDALLLAVGVLAGAALSQGLTLG